MKLFIIGIFVLMSGTLTLGAQNLGQIQPGQRGYIPPARTFEAGEPERPDVIIRSQERANIYEELLQIDAFQKEVLKSFLKDYYTERFDITYNANLKFDDKRELLNGVNKKFEETLLGVFTKDQVNIILSEEDKGKKTVEIAKEKKKEEKKRRKRKKKKNKS